ncbi:MAG TPA: aminotransferase class V-fold PLP-dependent enzyme [Acidiferrobacter sp.]|nr:aminotransferase class V-fold PLP-dependent enzyme [Acidiferrobacter sp.]
MMNGSGDSIYLDHNATSVVAPECIDAMLACLRPGIGNPSSPHRAGVRAKELIREARAQVARLIGAADREVVFTSSGTEANHMAILGALAERPGHPHVVTSVVEHPSTLMLLRHLEGHGVRVTYLPVDNSGRLSEAVVADAMTKDTALVTLMWANNETGVLFPIPAIAHAAHERGVLMHVDAVQAIGKLAIDLRQVPVDLVSISSHKLHAPAGAGALFVRKGIAITPLLFGHQERGRRGGTEGVAAIAAFGRACALAGDNIDSESLRVSRLRDRLEDGVLALYPGARVNGAAAARLPNTSNVCFGAHDGEHLMDALDRNGVAVSVGAACAAGGMEPSHVLMAMGLDRRAALASIRFSLGRYNTEAEIDHVLTRLPGVLREVAASAA